MKFLEQDLEDIIHEASQTEEGRIKLVNRGLYTVTSAMKRQVTLGCYGVADLIEVYGGFNNGLTIRVYELKKGTLIPEHFRQLCRYMTAIKRHCKDFDFDVEDYIRIKVEGVLIGREVNSSNDFCYLINESNPHISTFTYDFDLDDGLTFDESYGWTRTEESFSDIREWFYGIHTELDEEYLEYRKYKNQQELDAKQNN